MKRQLKAIYDNLSQEIISLPLKVKPVLKSKRYRKDGYNRTGANIVLKVVEELVEQEGEEVSRAWIRGISLVTQESTTL